MFKQALSAVIKWIPDGRSSFNCCNSILACCTIRSRQGCGNASPYADVSAPDRDGASQLQASAGSVEASAAINE